ncbi:MAG TPA: alpha/beta fold hydrolase [Armatimonadota bacterium]
MLPPLEFHRFEIEGQNLYGTLHRPEGVGPYPAIVMCHGFTGHRIESSWIFVKAAKRLAAAGFAVFRFDCRGSGESDGEFKDMTICSEVSDAMEAVDLVKSLPGIDAGRLGMLGFSMGGAVAAETVSQRSDIRTLCLWSPVADPPVQFAERISQIVGEYGDIGPDLLGKGFALDVANHCPVEAAKAWGGPVCVIRGTADPVIRESHARAYLNAPAPRKWIPVDGADHGWANAEHQRHLYAATIDWFRETL